MSRLLGACVVLCAALSAGAVAAPSPPPQLSLSATTANWGDELVVSVRRAARSEIRLYLVPRAAANSVRSRLDTRLSLIGSTRGRRLGFTVPPLDSGRYALVYWCRGCGAHALRSPTLHVARPLPDACPVTTPNRRAPPGAEGPAREWAFHGNGGLWALLPANATYGRPAAKIPWVARGVEPWRRLQVKYRRIDVPSPALSAVTVSGTLGGYDGPSWASRMAFEPGCWHVAGRVLDASLSFVVQVDD